MNPQRPEPRERLFNVPAAVVWLIAVMVAIHLVRKFGGRAVDEWLMLHFAFIPARIIPTEQFPDGLFPGGPGAKAWSFATYMLLHGSWLHVVVNSVWMLAFGAVIARRFGTVRFLLFSITGAVISAFATMVMYWADVVFLVGASGAISAHMGGAVRLMFASPSGLAGVREQDYSCVKALPLARVFASRHAVSFMAVWMGVNLLVGMTGIGTGEDIGRIAWEAHVGGFVAGLVLFGLFDPGPRRPSDGDDQLSL